MPKLGRTGKKDSYTQELQKGLKIKVSFSEARSMEIVESQNT